MAKELLSDAEIKRRKKRQGHIAQTTGALGLTSLGAFATGRAAGTGKYATKAQRAVPALKKINQKKADSVALGTSTAGAGIGGAGSFNFASYTNAESRKREVKKMDDDMPFTGEVGIAKRYEDEISKVGDWKTIDQREQTQRRDRKAMRQAGTVAGVGAGAVALGYKDGDKAKYQRFGQVTREVNDHHARMKGMNDLGFKGKFTRADQAKATAKTAVKTARSLSTTGKAGLAAIGGAAAVGGGAKAKHTYAQHKINQRRRSNVKKSAFDIQH